MTQIIGNANFRVRAWQKASLAIFVCLAMLLSIAQAHAQTQNGINGNVTDSIGEHVKLSLGVDYFNAFNRTQLQTPDNNSLDSTFGEITNLSSGISNRQGQGIFRVEF